MGREELAWYLQSGSPEGPGPQGHRTEAGTEEDVVSRGTPNSGGRAGEKVGSGGDVGTAQVGEEGGEGLCRQDATCEQAKVGGWETSHYKEGSAPPHRGRGRAVQGEAASGG